MASKMATQARQNRIFENSVDFQLKALGGKWGQKGVDFHENWKS